MPRYVPEAGDIVWLNFAPQAGHKQAGHRPALLLSPALYNDKTGLLICCQRDHSSPSRREDRHLPLISIDCLRKRRILQPDHSDHDPASAGVH